MGNDKASIVRRQFEIECRPWGYETKLKFKLKALTTSQVTTAEVPATPTQDQDARLKTKAKELARSIRTNEIRGCVFKRFLASAEQVLAPSHPQNFSDVFVPDSDGQIRVRAAWTKSARAGMDMFEIDKSQTFAIPAIAGENPLDTARRLLAEVREKGESVPRRGIEGSDINLVFSINGQEIGLVRQVIELEKDTESKRVVQESGAARHDESDVFFRGPGRFQQ